MVCQNGLRILSCAKRAESGALETGGGHIVYCQHLIKAPVSLLAVYCEEGSAPDRRARQMQGLWPYSRRLDVGV